MIVNLTFTLCLFFALEMTQYELYKKNLTPIMTLCGLRNDCCLSQMTLCDLHNDFMYPHNDFSVLIVTQYDFHNDSLLPHKDLCALYNVSV